MGSRTSTPKRIAPPTWRKRILLRPQLLAGLMILVLLGVGGKLLWQRNAATIARNPQYLITADSVRVTPRPPWVRSDIKAEVLRDAGLIGNISVLDDWDALVPKVRQAFEFHPWVAAVKRISRSLPNTLEVELEYRRPVAAVESSGQSGVVLSPIDAAAVRLPEADLTDFELRTLPRISSAAGRPVVGHAWDDSRVIGGVRLATALADIWQRLRLVEILPSSHPSVLGETRYYSYEIVTSGGTRVVWGAAPGEEQSAGESPLAAKRQRLLDFAAATGRLDAIDGPAAVDVRKDLVVTPRTAKRETTETEAR